MEAIILAGGFGTRLQSVVKDVPKPMADINGKPFLEYLLRYLSSYNINSVILSVGYKQNIIKNYFNDKFNNITIKYSCEEEPLGTGGAIKQALKYINPQTKDGVLIINGDTFFQLDLFKLQLADKNFDILLSVKKMKDFDRYGTVKIEDTKIIGFTEKKFQKEGYINCGVYIIKKDIFNSVSLNNFSFETFLQNNVDLNITPFISNASYFIDIGIPEDYKQSQIDFKEIF